MTEAEGAGGQLPRLKLGENPTVSVTSPGPGSVSPLPVCQGEFSFCIQLPLQSVIHSSP